MVFATNQQNYNWGNGPNGVALDCNVRPQNCLTSGMLMTAMLKLVAPLTSAWSHAA